MFCSNISGDAFAYEATFWQHWCAQLQHFHQHRRLEQLRAEVWTSSSSHTPATCCQANRSRRPTSCARGFLSAVSPLPQPSLFPISREDTTGSRDGTPTVSTDLLLDFAAHVRVLIHALVTHADQHRAWSCAAQLRFPTSWGSTLCVLQFLTNRKGCAAEIILNL